jgi:outer membrane protein assembly factor BamB
VLWSSTLTAEQSLAADADRVYVAAGEAIHALTAGAGDVSWRVPTGGAVTAAPLAQAGWVIAAAGGDLIAIRAADGVVIWRKHVGPIEFRPSLDGELLVVSLVEGQVLALDLRDGSTRWTTELHASPGEPLAIGGRVYVGTKSKWFYALLASSGRIEDQRPLGSEVRGRVAVDDQHVYVTALDNMVRAFKRRGGSVRWQKGLPYRPASGPVLVGNTVVVPGYVETPLPSFDAATGADGGTMKFDGALVALPVFTTLPDRRLAVVGVTGGLDNKWTVSLRTPSLVRAIAAQPLTALPGEAVPIPPLPRW